MIFKILTIQYLINMDNFHYSFTLNSHNLNKTYHDDPKRLFFVRESFIMHSLCNKFASPIKIWID